MADIDDGLDEAFNGFIQDESKPKDPPADDPAKKDDPATPPAQPPKAEEPKKDDDTPPADPDKKKEEPETPPADPAKKPEEPAQPPKAPETPPAAPEEPKPLTLDDVKSVIRDFRTEERTSGQAVETATKEVLDAYYPEGLSNVLTDTNGKELRTPQDVVDASGGQMSMEEAAQWLMNEQYKLDQDVAKIKSDAKQIAETTLKFKQDGEAVLVKYDPVFKRYPQLQEKVWNQFKKLVKADEAKGVILSAPDMMEFYDTVLDPYRLAVEYATKNPGTNPTPPANPETPPAKPGADDRLDDTGDGGASEVDDPNDFAQQVKKELAKGL